MTIEDLCTRIQSIIDELEGEAERVTKAMAMRSIDLVRTRSIRDGIFIDGQEGSFGQYSSKGYPTFFLWNKARNQEGRNWIKANKYGTWQQFKQAQGIPADNVNLVYTNRMWASIAVIQQGKDGDNIFARIGSEDSDVLNYIGFLGNRYGNFLQPTQSEQDQIIQEGVQELTSFITRKLNS